MVSAGGDTSARWFAAMLAALQSSRSDVARLQEELAADTAQSSTLQPAGLFAGNVGEAVDEEKEALKRTARQLKKKLRDTSKKLRDFEVGVGAVVRPFARAR